jgi:hypothetical protein
MLHCGSNITNRVPLFFILTAAWAGARRGLDPMSRNRFSIYSVFPQASVQKFHGARARSFLRDAGAPAAHDEAHGGASLRPNTIALKGQICGKALEWSQSPAIRANPPPLSAPTRGAGAQTDARLYQSADRLKVKTQSDCRLWAVIGPPFAKDDRIRAVNGSVRPCAECATRPSSGRSFHALTAIPRCPSRSTIDCC